MSGYIGNPDAEAEHALILAENGVYESQLALIGPIATVCVDCGDDIPEQRVAYARLHNFTCVRCVSCQSIAEQQPRRKIKMLDRIL